MRCCQAARSERGYTLVETMMAVMLIGILASMAMFQIGAARPALQGDGAMRAVMSELNGARELAVSQRRQMLVTFVGPNVLQVSRIELDPDVDPTLLRQVVLEAGVQYSLLDGVTQDTPDAFGNDAAVDFGASPTIGFSTDGSLVDAAGSPINGSVFLAIPGVQQSFRAVTVLGSTGRVRGYRWNGTQWNRV